MGRAIEGIPWPKIELAYKAGQGSCREIAEQFNVSTIAVQRRCNRLKWNAEKVTIGQRVVEKTIERQVDKRLKAIEDMESLTVPVALKLTKGVSESYDSMNGQPIDSAHLQGLAMALKTANAVARLNLGAVDPTAKLDIMSNGQGLSMHENSLRLLESVRKLHSEGKLADTVIDVEGLSRELKESQTDTS